MPLPVASTAAEIEHFAAGIVNVDHRVYVTRKRFVRMPVYVVCQCQVAPLSLRAEKLPVVRAMAFDDLVALPKLAGVPAIDGRVA